MSDQISAANEPAEALLVLEDGRFFKGYSFAAQGEVFGQAALLPDSASYQASLTDPGRYQQVLIAAAPHIGNTGWTEQDNESSQIYAAGLVVRQFSRLASNWQAVSSLPEALTAGGVVGISGVDTRALTRHLQANGPLRVGISTLDSDVDSLLAKVKASQPVNGKNLAAEVSTKTSYQVVADEEVAEIALIDLGVPASMLAEFTARGLSVRVLPETTTFADLQENPPAGLVLSPGPGDPRTANTQIGLVQEAIAQKIPVLAVGLGQSILTQALGLPLIETKSAHLGTKSPVRSLADNSIDIGVHNHWLSAEISTDELETELGTLAVTHRSEPERSVAGFRLLADAKVIALARQYLPLAESSSGARKELFDDFAALVLAGKGAK